MHDAECIMHNYGIPFGDDLKSISEGLHPLIKFRSMTDEVGSWRADDTLILHYAFSI